VNFILLGEIVRRVSGQSLAEFAARELFAPLKMKDTRFLPPSELRPRIAPTEGTLRGVVHDAKARLMGGVAGHAGVFSTAADLARLARLMLNLGELDGVRVFSPATVRLMTSVQSPPGLPVKRGLGWDVDSPYAAPRGKIFPIGSYGHTGWIGTSLWIDPGSQSFIIFLCNRNHPRDRGNVVALRSVLGTLAAEAVGLTALPGAVTKPK
jgi:CubicO group peptidase (beta-lactamase class C family)